MKGKHKKRYYYELKFIEYGIDRNKYKTYNQARCRYYYLKDINFDFIEAKNKDIFNKYKDILVDLLVFKDKLDKFKLKKNRTKRKYENEILSYGIDRTIYTTYDMARRRYLYLKNNKERIELSKKKKDDYYDKEFKKYSIDRTIYNTLDKAKRRYYYLKRLKNEGKELRKKKEKKKRVLLTPEEKKIRRRIIVEKTLKKLKEKRREKREEKENSIDHKYLSDLSLTREIILSQGKGYPTDKLKVYLYKMCSNINNKFYYSDLNLKYDITMNSYVYILNNYMGFNYNKYKKSFSYITEVIKRNQANQFNKFKLKGMKNTKSTQIQYIGLNIFDNKKDD